jgi:hypothetical protein
MSDCTLIVEFDEQKIDAIFAELDQCRLPGAAVSMRALTFRRDGAASAGGAAPGMAKVFVDRPWCRFSVRTS